MSAFADRDGMELDVGERDVDIEETARVRLQHSPYHAVRLVNCTFQNGVLKLTGHVPTFHYKQLAQTTIADLRGVIQVVNDIHVQ